MVWNFAAAAVASCTALLIAFVAYPWQKQRDRELEIHRERREAYSRFFAAYDEFARLVVKEDAKSIDSTMILMRVALNDLVLSGDDSAADACTESFNELWQWYQSRLHDDDSDATAALRESAKQKKAYAMEAARLSLHGLSSREFRELLKAAWHGDLKGKL